MARPRKICDCSRPVGAESCCRVHRQAAEGLQHAHEAGLVHRDIKPSNLLLDRQESVRLLDLGLARFLVDSRRNQGVTEQFDANVILGTVDYMAPEQAIDSSRVDIRADVYSLGCTLYFLLTGKPVFEADAFAQKMLATKCVTQLRFEIAVLRFPRVWRLSSRR